MRSKEKVTLKWSKKENDFIARYPEWKNRNGRITGIAFGNMIRVFEESMSKNWKGEKTDFTTLRKYLSDGGFDSRPFTW